MGAEDSAREWRKGDSEEWPTEHTEYTERGAGSGGVAGGSREGGGVFYHERRDGRRAGAGDVARELREGTRTAKRGFGRVAHGTHGKGEDGGRDPETEAGENSGAGGRRT
jgi:hypothetical protein